MRDFLEIRDMGAPAARRMASEDGLDREQIGRDSQEDGQAIMFRNNGLTVERGSENIDGLEVINEFSRSVEGDVAVVNEIVEENETEADEQEVGTLGGIEGPGLEHDGMEGMARTDEGVAMELRISYIN